MLAIPLDRFDLHRSLTEKLAFGSRRAYAWWPGTATSLPATARHCLAVGSCYAAARSRHFPGWWLRPCLVAESRQPLACSRVPMPGGRVPPRPGLQLPRPCLVAGNRRTHAWQPATAAPMPGGREPPRSCLVAGNR